MAVSRTRAASVGADQLRRLLEADGLVVFADGRLGRRREQRLRQLRGLPAGPRVV